MPYSLAFRYNREEDWRCRDDFFFMDKADAGAKVKELNSRATYLGNQIRYKVVPILPGDPNAWRGVVEARFASGEWKPLPTKLTFSRVAYQHIHADDPTKVAFYMNVDDAQEDRLTIMSPGKYYLRYLDSCASADIVDKFCADMGLDNVVSELMLATTAEEIVNVYINGPHSCMAYPMNNENYTIKDHHPCEVYAAGDLAVAYITRDGEITARSLVWPERKHYGRIYGDRARLEKRLKDAGYEEDWNVIGAKLHYKKDANGQIIAPYIDDNDVGGIIDETGKFIILSYEPHLILKSPDGTPEATECAECGAQNVHIMWNNNIDCYTCEEHF